MARLELNIDKYIIERERKEKGEEGEGEEREGRGRRGRGRRGERRGGERRGREGRGVGKSNKYARSILKLCSIVCKKYAETMYHSMQGVY